MSKQPKKKNVRTRTPEQQARVEAQRARTAQSLAKRQQMSDEVRSQLAWEKFLGVADKA
jgi:hypothetical protein